jgi:hypothetical protein
MLPNMPNIIDGVIAKVAVIYELAQLMNNRELLEKIAGLQKELIDAREAHIKLLQEKSELSQENIDLREQLTLLNSAVIRKLQFIETAYFDRETGEAYCPGCIDAAHTPVRLVPIASDLLKTTHRCPRCKERFKLH